MSSNAEGETNPPEMADMLRLDGSVGRALESIQRSWIQISLQSKFSYYSHRISLLRVDLIIIIFT